MHVILGLCRRKLFHHRPNACFSLYFDALMKLLLITLFQIIAKNLKVESNVCKTALYCIICRSTLFPNLFLSRLFASITTWTLMLMLLAISLEVGLYYYFTASSANRVLTLYLSKFSINHNFLAKCAFLHQYKLDG